MSALAGGPRPPQPGELLEYGPPLIDVPDLPHAWSTPYLAIIDSVRVVIIFGSLYLVYLLAFHALVVRTWHQRAVTMAFCLSVVSSLWTQVERIGRPVSWRLFIVGAVVILGVTGALRYMTGGRRVRDLPLSSFLRPPPPPPPAIPLETLRRLQDEPPHPKPDDEDPS